MQFTHTLDCGDIGEIDATVSFDYEPAEEMVMYPNEDAHPGCAEMATVTSVMGTINNIYMELLPLLSEEVIELLAEAALESMGEE